MRTLWLVLLSSLLSCVPGTVAPEDAKPEDLAGWWTSSEDGVERIYGFTLPPAGPFNLPVGAANGGAPVSGLYSPDPKLYAQYDVRGGQLLETVIDSVDFDPGKQFSTRILSLVRGDTLTLEATTATNKQRTWKWHERCERVIATGWSRSDMLMNLPYFASVPAMAFDSKGRLHTYAGMAGAQDGAYPSRPAYGVWDRGCELVRFPMSNARASALVVDGDDVVHLVTTESAIYSELPDSTLVHRWRHTDSMEWTTEVLSSVPVSRTFHLVARGSRLVLVGGALTDVTPSRGLEVLERGAQGWAARPVVVAGVTRTNGVQGVGFDGEGRLVLAVDGGFLREAGADFELVAAPALTGTFLDFYTDASGGLHWLVLGDDGAVHVHFDGATWAQLAAPKAERFVRAQAAPWRFLSRTEETFPHLVLATQEASGLMRYEWVSPLQLNPGAHTSTASAVAPDGTIAMTGSGEQANLKRPAAPWGQVAQTTFTITIAGTGSGRVVSDDGVVDCTSTCELTLPLYTRLRLRASAVPGSVLVKGGDRAGVAWIDVLPPAELGLNGKNAVAFEFTRAAVLEAIPVSPVSGSLGTVSQFDARGGRVLVASTSTAGKAWFGDAEYSAPDAGAGDVLLLAAPPATPELRRLPAPPAAVSLLEGGGAQGVFFANRALSFDGTTLGASTAPVVVRVAWTGALAQTSADVVLTAPSGARLLTAATHASGSAAAVVQSNSGFPTLTPGVTLALAWRSAAGQARLTALPGITAPAQLAVDGTRALVLSGTRMLLFDDGLPAGERVLIGADFTLAAFGADGVHALVTLTSGGSELGGGSINSTSGRQYLARYGFDGAFTSQRELDGFTKPLALAPQARGTLVFDQSVAGPFITFAGGLTYEYLVIPNTAVRAVSARAAGDEVWALVQQQSASVTYGTGAVTGAGRFVLVRVAMP